MTTPTHPASFILPPSPRDLEIHRQNAVELLSTRTLAEQFALSQTRVRQIVARVNDWLAQMLPIPTEADLERQKRLATHLAAAQLHHQVEQLQIFWTATSDPKYLRQQTRAILALARLGVPAGALDALTATLEDEQVKVPSSSNLAPSTLPFPSPAWGLLTKNRLPLASRYHARRTSSPKSLPNTGFRRIPEL